MQKKESAETRITRTRAKWGVSQRKWASIIGGGVFGLAMMQVLTLIVTRQIHIESLGAFLGALIGLATVSIFLGSMLAGVIDEGDAAERGMEAALFALFINVIISIVIGFSIGIPGFYMIISLVIIYTTFIHISFGAIGGRVGGLLRRGR
jgi:hypothetical protein